jgi:predicted nucleotidyltransferase
VTTDDFDFMFRPTRTNVAKLKQIAEFLGTTVTRPHYPESRLYRILNVEEGIQIDMMGVVDGVTSFESLRSRSKAISFGRYSLLIADLEDVIKSKREAGREKDLAALPALESTLKRK